MITKAKYRRFLKDQNGAVAATYALALFGLLGITGLAFDYARMVSMDTELQNAADQAALAGATQLTLRSGSMQAAIAAIQGGLVSNSTLISNDGSGRTINVTNAAQIVFYNSRAAAEARTGGFTDVARFAEARFVQVTVDTRGVNYALTPVVGAFRGDLAAEATAGMGSALCRIPPLMICNPYESPTPPTTGPEEPFNIADAMGRGLLAKPGGGSQWTPGNYGYLDIGTNGAIGVREALGWDGPGGRCLAQDGVDAEEPGEVDTQTGNIASGPQALNTRFDLYSSQGCVNSGICSPALNSRKDLMRPFNLTPATGNSCDVGNNGWREPTNAYHPTSTGWYSNTPQSMGHPRDVCHAVEDGTTGECKNNPFGPAVSAGVEGSTPGNWDRDTYFRTHYGWTTRADWLAGIASASGSLKSSPGGLSQISRYDVYKWEEKNPGARLFNTPATASGNTLVTRNQPVCGQQYGFTPKTDPVDRRLVSVAVINCKRHDVKGNTKGVPVATWVDVFLVQPSVDRGPGNKFTRKDEIYGEVVGETDVTRVGAPIGPTIRRDVPYLVR